MPDQVQTQDLSSDCSSVITAWSGKSAAGEWVWFIARATSISTAKSPFESSTLERLPMRRRGAESR